MFDISQSAPFECLGKPVLIYPIRTQSRSSWSTFAELDLWSGRNIRDDCNTVLEESFKHPPLVPQWHCKAEPSDGAEYSPSHVGDMPRNFVVIDGNDDASDEPDVDENNFNPHWRDPHLRGHGAGNDNPLGNVLKAIRHVEMLDGSPPYLHHWHAYLKSLTRSSECEGFQPDAAFIKIWRQIMTYMTLEQLTEVNEVARVLARSRAPLHRALRHCIPHLTCAHFTETVHMTKSDERYKLIAEIPLGVPRSVDGARGSHSCFALAIYISARDQAWGFRKGEYLAAYYKVEKQAMRAIAYHQLLPEPIEHNWRDYRILLKHEYLEDADVVRIFAKIGGGGGHAMVIRQFGWIRCCHQIVNVDVADVWARRICADPTLSYKVTDLITRFLPAENKHILAYALGRRG